MADAYSGLSFEVIGAGPPLIALHGFGATRFTWRHLVPSLSNNHTLYLFDLRGHGMSEIPDDLNYTLQSQAETIARFIHDKQLTDVTIIGHSMGGGIALLVALQLLPKQGQLRSLLLIDSIGLPQRLPSFIWAMTIPLFGWLVPAMLPAEVLVRRVLRAIFFDSQKVDEAAVEAYAANVRTCRRAHALATTAKQIVPSDALNLAGRLQEVATPALIIAGLDDPCVSPAIATTLNVLLPDSHLVLIPECGHLPHEEKPAEVSALIAEFLRERSGVSS